jgi:dTDP-4-dehydrorhamnose 3,5-epimerase
VHVQPLAVPHSWVFTPIVHPDERGRFLEYFKADVFTAVVGHPFHVAQANHSISSRGVIRGIHYADVPPGQAKYVYCTAGSILDIVVDIRVGSPAFGTVETLTLDAERHRAAYLAEGVGHAFVALTDEASVTYLCSTPYTPAAEHPLDPLDPELAITWPDDIAPTLSPRDAAAPTLAQARDAGALPDYATCLARYEELRR